MADSQKTPSGQFTPPPAHAPRETASAPPVVTAADIRQRQQDAEVRAEQRRAAGDAVAVPSGEQDLPVYAPKPLTREQQIALIGLEAVERAEHAEAAVRKPTMDQQIAEMNQITLAEIERGQQEALAATVTGADATPSPAAAPMVTSSFKPVDVPLRSRSLRHRTPPPAVTVAAETTTQESTGRVSAEYPNKAGQETEIDQSSLDGIPTPLAPSSSPSHQPAASDSDSPSRGLPKAIADPGKQITGGFGDAGEAQYYPLDGREAGEVVIALCDDIVQRVKDDLRFSMAVTYPRIRLRVSVEVDAFAIDQSFQIEKIAVHDKTPKEIAARYADHVAFCVISERAEMTPDGQSVTPPNAMRMEVGLAVPSKRRIETPGGRMFVDVVDDVEPRTP